MAEGMRDEGEGRKDGRKPSHEFFMKIRKTIVNIPVPISKPSRRRGRLKKEKETSGAEITPALEKSRALS